MTHSYLDVINYFSTILDFLRFGISEAKKHHIFFGHGTDNAQDDLYHLILGSLNLPFNIDACYLNAKLTKEEKIWLSSQLEKRILKRIPTAYILNEAFFCNLEFFVDERVLIPRSPHRRAYSAGILP